MQRDGAIGRKMQHDCAVLRTAPVPEEGSVGSPNSRGHSTTSPSPNRSVISNTDLVAVLEFDNLIGQARSCSIQPYTAPKAAARTPREDYPERDDENSLKHILAWARRRRRPPGASLPLSNKVPSFPSSERVY
jgi:succinate dehydrogenase / fumarate reductase flavoprotein subunit